METLIPTYISLGAPLKLIRDYYSDFSSFFPQSTRTDQNTSSTKFLNVEMYHWPSELIRTRP